MSATDRGEAARNGNRKKGANGRLPERPVGPTLYNFRRPDKFSKDHIRSIGSIQEAFSRSATNYLASKIRSASHVELTGQEQSTFGEYIDQLPTPTVLFVSELDPLAGSVVIQMDRALALMIVDRLLGGPGIAKLDRGGTTLTEIEMLLLEDLGNGLYSEFIGAWEQVAQLRSERCEVVLSPQQVQGVLPTEVALVIRHDVRIAGYKGKLTICLPASTLEPLMPRLNARLLFANPRTAGGVETERDLAAQLENAPLTVRAEVGRATVKVADLFALEIGDTIRLDGSAHAPLVVRVEDEMRFLAQPGQRGGQLAVRIVAITDDEYGEDFAEGVARGE
jgi:flagellar motor switch protein FliM